LNGKKRRMGPKWGLEKGPLKKETCGRNVVSVKHKREKKRKRTKKGGGSHEDRRGKVWSAKKRARRRGENRPGAKAIVKGGSSTRARIP